MPTVVLLNHVNADGTGDYSHLEDIYHALIENPNLRDYEFIPVISVAPVQYEKIKNRLSQLRVKKFFIAADTENLYENHDLQGCLRQADQVVLVSHANLPEMAQYRKHFNPRAQLKFIGEHEGSQYCIQRLEAEGWSNRSLGLAPNRYGLKLTREERLDLPHSLEIIAEEKENPFLAALLQHSRSDTLTSFAQRNELIPAYFNQHGFEGFLLFLALNPELSPGKDISIYLSGNYVLDPNFDFPKTMQVNRVEVVRPDGRIEVIYSANHSRNQVIRIFQGFNLSDKAYRAIYQQAPYAGVSGDNTFEKALSNLVFPFYHSTNFAMKRPSLLALATIVQHLPLTPKLISDYQFYFRYINLFSNTFVSGRSKLRADAVDRFGLQMNQRLDFPAMIKAWPVVANYLHENHNFYSHLEEVILENANRGLIRSTAPVADLETKETDRPVFSPVIAEEKDEVFEATRTAILKILGQYQKAWFKSDDRIKNVNKLIADMQRVQGRNEILFSLLDNASENARKSDAEANRSRWCCFFKRNLTGSRYQTVLDRATDVIVKQYI